MHEKIKNQIMIRKFKDLYRLSPRMMYMLFRFMRIEKETTKTIINMLLDYATPVADVMDAKEYMERYNRWKEREKLFLIRG